MYLTRTVSFSSGHRYWRNDLSLDENRKLFGSTASAYNHGHNYVLAVTIGGRADEQDGMVMNIKDLDQILRTKILTMFDGKSMNDEVPPFKTCNPALENMLLCIWDLLVGSPLKLACSYPQNWRWDADLLKVLDSSSSLPDNVSVYAMSLAETPFLFGSIHSTGHKNQMTLTRSFEFSASHRLHLDSLSLEANLDLFGKCNNPGGHGHNYILEVTVEGEPDAETGMLVNLDKLDARVESRVVERFDHKNLNTDIPELRGKNPTTEVLATTIFKLLDGHLPAKLSAVKIHETARNSFEVRAG